MEHQHSSVQKKQDSKLNNQSNQATHGQQSVTAPIPHNLTSDAILALQQSHGNQYVQRLLSESPPSLIKSSISLLDRSFIQRVSFNATPWEDATGAVVKPSGHGGVVFVSFGTEKIVVKKGTPNEAFAAGLAAQAGLHAPQTRQVESEEASRIENAIGQYDVQVPNGRPYLVLEHFDGVDLSDVRDQEVALTKDQVESLARSLGRWLAFDILIAENDRFGLLNGGLGHNVNSANFLLDPTSHMPQIVGIDQFVMSSDTKGGEEVYDTIKKGDLSSGIAYSIGMMAYNYTGKVKGTNPEGLDEIVMAGAKEQMLTIGQSLDETEVRQLALSLGVGENAVEGLLKRLEKFKS